MNSIGTLFRVTSFGESHGKCLGVVIDGCPAGLRLNIDGIQMELDRRRPGQSGLTTNRDEPDRVEVLSGVFEGQTTGAPVCMLVWNRNQDSSKYDMERTMPRPGHADYPAIVRYGGFNDHRGGGRFSGRITVGHVMAGALAKQLLNEKLGVEVLAYTASLGGIFAPCPSIEEIRMNTEKNPVRCPHPESAERMEQLILKAKDEGDSLGGVVKCIALNMPPGVGQPIFDTLEGDLSKVLFAVPAVKAVEFGVGVEYANLRGSESNDPYMLEAGKVAQKSNNSGGILGGLSDGAAIILRATFKPTPSISRPQRTINLSTMEETEISIKGRHDPCIVPRAVPVVEAVVAMALVDHAMRRGLIPQVLEEDR